MRLGSGTDPGKFVRVLGSETPDRGKFDAPQFGPARWAPPGAPAPG